MKTLQVSSVLAGNLPPGNSQSQVWSPKESGAIATGLDNFHFDDTTPPNSVGSSGRTTEPFSPYNFYNGGNTGSMMEFQDNQVYSQQMTPLSSNSSIMMASLPTDNNSTQQNNRGDYYLFVKLMWKIYLKKMNIHFSWAHCLSRYKSMRLYTVFYFT